MGNVVLKVEAEKILDCDVLVVGLGMSGFSAAVSAARAGVRVVAAEKFGFPGGVATAGLMASISNYFVNRDGEQITKGLPIELLDRMVEAGGLQKDYMRKNQPQIPLDPEILKRVMIKMLTESGVVTLYNSVFLDVIKQENLVTDVVFHGMDSIYSISAKQIIDATGDLAVFRRAGGDFEEQEDAGTLCYRMDNVDIDKIVDWFEQNSESYSEQMDIPTSLEDTITNWRKYGVFHLPHGGGGNIDVVKKALDKGVFDKNYGEHCTNREGFGLFSCRANNGAVIINSNKFIGNCYKVQIESERENEARLHIESQVEFLKSYFPGFENAYLRDSAIQIGHRFPRRAICNKMFMLDSFLNGEEVDDCIGYVGEVDRRTTPYGLMKKSGKLPLSMIISDDLPNVIVGSAKNPYTEKYGMIRGQAGCLVMGRGAGVTAAVACKNNSTVNLVEIEKIQEELLKQGM